MLVLDSGRVHQLVEDGALPAVRLEVDGLRTALAPEVGVAPVSAVAEHHVVGVLRRSRSHGEADRSELAGSPVDVGP